MTGVDLTRIDGMDSYAALKVVSEIGTDMAERGPLRPLLSPENRITNGIVIRSKTKPSASRTAKALRLAAFLRRKIAQLGVPKAITAMAHKLARIIYSMLRDGQEYVDAGAEHYERQHLQKACGP